MYSFRYDEDETWAVWPRRTNLSAFTDGIGKTVIAQIFRRLLADVRELLNELKEKMLNEKSLLAKEMNELLTSLERYRTDVQINEVFARYFVATHHRMFLRPADVSRSDFIFYL